MNPIDRETARAIHALTKKSPTTNYRALSVKLGLSVSAVQARLKRLEALGIVPVRPGALQNAVRLDPSIVVIRGNVYRMEKIA